MRHVSVNLAIGLGKVVDHKMCGQLNANLANLANNLANNLATTTACLLHPC